MGGPADRLLLARIARRDEAAFATLVERYAARLLAVARRLLTSRADAEDAVQRALLQAYLGAASYRPAWALSTWLYRILTNVCIDELRRRETRARHADATRRLAPPGVPPGGAGDVDLQRALARVPREARVLLALHYVDGLSYQELARVRGISVNTVKSQLARGKAILRRGLDEGGRS
jgi:RNA polymerase sigma-70 factor (ECF subfamily)